jgi:hypothetical protein
MKKAVRIFAIAGILLLSMHDTSARDTGEADSTRDIYIRLDVAYIIGGQVYNDNFLYNPGFSLFGVSGIHVNERVSVGLGTGYQQLRNERFIPVFIDLTGSVSKKANTRQIWMQGGYSFAWSDSLRNLTGYRLNGGIYISAGLGFRFRLNETLSIVPGFSYRHQFAEFEYDVFNQREYKEQANFDMLVIGISFLF